MSQKITHEQVHLAYNLGKEVFAGKLTLQMASEELASSLDMNQGSAHGYIYTLQKMLDGDEYRRTINAYATEYYLSAIYKDFGEFKLGVALEALRKHLEYYEGVGKSKQPIQHQIADKYLEIYTSNSDKELLTQNFEDSVKKSFDDSQENRLTRLKAANKNPSNQTVEITVFRRNPDVVAEVLHRASGVCEKCKKNAPFRRRTDGTPYLEVHHIIQLSQGGDDTIENAMALCPNCHREAHHG